MRIVSLAPILLACACGSDGGGIALCGPVISGGGVMKDFQAPCDPGPKGILITASGEAFGQTGYAFPKVNPDDVEFVDGWAITYDRVLVTFDKVTLSENPDLVPSDQSKTGALVAEQDGPWAVDLHEVGTNPGKGDEKTFAVTAFNGKNANGASGSFDSTVKYAFGFKSVAASAAAQNVNLDAAGMTDYQEMITKGYTLLLVGTATWRGGGAGITCHTSDEGMPSPYNFAQVPTTVKFRLGFETPTTYINAQNPDLGDIPPDSHPRGVQVLDNQSIIAQATFHLDHAFWESFVHDSPAHFDQYAVRYVGTAGVPTVRLEDFAGKTFQPIKDANNASVPWRWCDPGYTAPPGVAMSFDTNGVSAIPGGNPANTIADFVGYQDYNQSTFGHLNADGLSFVSRDYPSPP